LEVRKSIDKKELIHPPQNIQDLDGSNASGHKASFLDQTETTKALHTMVTPTITKASTLNSLGGSNASDHKASFLDQTETPKALHTMVTPTITKAKGNNVRPYVFVQGQPISHIIPGVPLVPAKRRMAKIIQAVLADAQENKPITLPNNLVIEPLD